MSKNKSTTQTSTSAKSSTESAVETRQLVMPEHTNPQNTIFGGVLMSWIDITAAMTASRHCGKPVVTANIDSISFKAPLKVGHHVCVKAMVNYVGRSSMEIGVKVLGENPYTGESWVCTTAYVTMVALDSLGKPTPVPALILRTDEDHRRHTNALKRVKQREEWRSSGTSKAN